MRSIWVKIEVVIIAKGNDFLVAGITGSSTKYTNNGYD